MKNTETIILTSHYAETFGWLNDFLKGKGVKKIAFIIDAKKPRLATNPDYVFTDKLMFEDAGFLVDSIDLGVTTELEDTLSEYDAIYVKGGNTFYLLDAIRKSGFDKIIRKLLAKGLIYIGESAGTYVACPTIEMAHWKHQDADIVGLHDLTAMGLVPYLVTVHYRKEFEEVVRKETVKSVFEVKILRDGEVLLVENGVTKMIK